MPRRACPVTQAAIARAIRAARQEGACAIKILPDGTIWIDPNRVHGENPQLAKERLADENYLAGINGKREAVL
jgi:hypothetical protein